MTRPRLDQALVDRGLCPSREKAKRAILAGQVRVGGQAVCQAGHLVKPDDALTLDAPERYVSRGGHKLEHGLRHFEIGVAGVTAIDLGASTGGFTDCLLQHGAARVYAVDVGRGQLAWKLRRDARVVVMEKINARYLTRRDFPADFAGVGLIVADCSFISLQKILPPAVALLEESGKILALVKPQFEAGKAEAGRGRGVIRDPAIHARVLNELKTFASDTAGLRWTGETPSPLLGPAGNKEFLVLLEKKR
jgi:23S rRNA (cytidine1920-2'-O)/16S rRNA (cytidine1409-2'-O)-methyltransferase